MDHTMHVPLQLLSDTLLKRKIPTSTLYWAREDADCVYEIGSSYVGRLQLKTGSFTKVPNLSSIIKKAAAVNHTRDGIYVYGILCSGDLFFWNKQTKVIQNAKGIPELATHPIHNVSRDPDDGLLQAAVDFFKNLQSQTSENNSTPENDQLSSPCFVPSHQWPRIFASSDCSKVIVVLGGIQVYTWERDPVVDVEKRGSCSVCGVWSVVPCPSNVPMPSLQSLESQISCNFYLRGNVEGECLISFSFIDASCLITTTLTLQWRGIVGNVSHGHIASSFWHSVAVSFKANRMEDLEILQREDSLVCRYAPGQRLLCIALNPQHHFPRLLYLHPMCSTAVVVNVGDSIGQLELNDYQPHQVCDIAWSSDSTFVVGTLISGALFMSTRMGPLLKVSCVGESLNLQPASTLQVHYKCSRGDIQNNKRRNCSRVAVSVSFHPQKNLLLVSSGFRVTVLGLPEFGQRSEEVADQLITAGRHALHMLRNSSITHNYAYIHCSTWRLAQSIPDLSRNLGEVMKAKGYEVCLWSKENLYQADTKVKRNVFVTEGEQLIWQAIEPLLAAWTLAATHLPPQTSEWRKRVQNITRLFVKLITVLTQTTLDDDRLEHQAQLLHLLHVFHHFVEVLALCPRALHMIRPTEWLTHRFIHQLLRCERHAGESSMIDTLLILTQMLSSVDQMFSSTFTFRPALQSPNSLAYGNIVGAAPSIEVTNVVPSYTPYAENSISNSNVLAVNLTLKKLWLCIYVNTKSVYSRIQENKIKNTMYQKAATVINLVQGRLQGFGYDFSSRRVKLSTSIRLYLNGKVFEAIDCWKQEIIEYLHNPSCKTIVSRNLHSILYAYVIENDFIGISIFLLWLFSLIKQSNFVTLKTTSTKSSSHKDHIIKHSTPKSKSNVDDLALSHLSSGISIIKADDCIHPADTEMTSRKKTKSNLSDHLLSKHTNEEPAGDTAKENGIDNKVGHSQSSSCNTKRQEVFIASTRRVIGSVGRIMALVILQQDLFVSSPHRPHVMHPIWMNDRGKREHKRAIHCPSAIQAAVRDGQWSPETTAQALAVAGYWHDLTAFAKELGDTRMTLLFSIIAMKTSKTRDSVPSYLHPSTLIRDLVLHPDLLQQSGPLRFQSYQELMQLAAMNCLEVLPDILENCLNLINEKVNHLEIMVSTEIYLPAPPVFCPQLPNDSEMECHLQNEQNRYDEKQLRREISDYVHLFLSVVSAAGVARYLLKIFCERCEQATRRVSDTHVEDIRNIAESLGSTDETLYVPEGSEWLRITDLWQNFLRIVWILHARDKLCLNVRKFAASAADPYKGRKKRNENNSVDTLLWAQEIFRHISIDSWKNEMVALALTAASNSPPSASIAQYLANVMNEPSNLSSLLKGKASRLFDTWKSVDASEISYSCGPDNKSMFQTHSNLYELFEKKCIEVAGRCKTNAEVPYGEAHTSTRTTQSRLLETASDFAEGKLREMVLLLASMTFCRDAEAFPQKVALIPQLPQFSEVIKENEFQGLRLKFPLSQNKANYDSGLTKKSFVSSKYFDHGDNFGKEAKREKKGLFRSKNNSVTLRGDTKIIYNSNVSQNLQKWGKSYTQTTRSLSSSPALERSLRKKVNQQQKNTSGISPLKRSQRSHRRTPNKSVAQSESRYDGSDISKRKYRSRSSSPRSSSRPVAKRFIVNLNDSLVLQHQLVIRESPIKNLLFLTSSFTSHIKDENFIEIVKLTHWLMSLERKFCTNSLCHKEDTSITKKIEVGVEEIVLGLSWNYLKAFPVEDNNLGDVDLTERDEIDGRNLTPLEQAINKSMRIKHRKKQGSTPNQTSTAHVSTDVKLEGVNSSYKHESSNSSIGRSKAEVDKVDSPQCKSSLSEKIRVNLKNQVEEGGLKQDLPMTAHDFQLTEGGETVTSKSSSKEDFVNPSIKEYSGEELSQGNKNAKDERKQRVSGEDSSHLIQIPNVTKMTLQNVVREEINRFFQNQNTGFPAAMETINSEHQVAQPTHCKPDVMQEIMSKDTSVDLSAEEKNSRQHKGDSSSVLIGSRMQENAVANSSSVLNDNKMKDSVAAHETLSEQSETKNTWKPFRDKFGISRRPSRRVIEVEEADKLPLLHETYSVQPKMPLTPVEIPDEQEPAGISSKVDEESKGLCLSDLHSDEEYVSDNSVVVPVDNTLDDLTLPESLCESDLANQEEYNITSQDMIQDNIIKKYRYRPDKDTKGDQTKMRTTFTLRNPRIPIPAANTSPERDKGDLQKTSHELDKGGLHKTSREWDKGDLQLKPIPLKIKPAVVDNAVTSKQSSIISQGHVQVRETEKNKYSLKQLKLLTIPKHTQKQESNDVQEKCKPLVLTKVPPEVIMQMCERRRNIPFTKTNKEDSGHNVQGQIRVTKELDSSKPYKCMEVQKNGLLKLPTPKVYSSRVPETSKPLRFMNPDQVYDFYRKHMGRPKFKTLKVGGDPARNRISVIECDKAVATDVEREKRIKQETRIVADTQNRMKGKFGGDRVENISRYQEQNHKSLVMAEPVERPKFAEVKVGVTTTRMVDKASQGEDCCCLSTKETQTCSSENAETLPDSLSKDFISTKTVSGMTKANAQLETERNEGSTFTNRPDEVKKETRRLVSKSEQSGGNLKNGDSERKIIKVKDSWTETEPIEPSHIPVSDVSEMQTQTSPISVEKTSVSIQVSTKPSSPQPTTRESINVQTPSDNILYCDSPPIHMFKNVSRGSVSQTVEMPKEIVLKRLQDIGSEVDQPVCALDTASKNAARALFSDEQNANVQIHSLFDDDQSADIQNHSETVTHFDAVQTSVVGEPKMEKESVTVVTSREHLKDREFLVNQNIPKQQHENVAPTEEFVSNLGAANQNYFTPPEINENMEVKDVFSNDGLTANDLMEAFMAGKITFDEFCKVSVHLPPGEESQEKESGQEEGRDLQKIEELEKAVVEATHSLSKSKNIISKVDMLLQVSEYAQDIQSNRQGVRNKSSTEVEKSNFYVSKPAEFNITQCPEWEEVHLSYRKTGNANILLQFLENLNPDDMTDKVIDEIMKCIQTDLDQNSSKRALSSESPGSSRKMPRCRSRSAGGLAEMQTLQSMDISDLSEIDRDYPQINSKQKLQGSERTLEAIEGCIDGIRMSGNTSPRIHLDLSGIRSDSSTRPSCTASTADDEKRKRRAEIRAWMNKKRKKFAQSMAVPHNQIVKNSSGNKNLKNSYENQGLSGKQLRERSKEREEKREHLRSELQKKREQDICKLLLDHEEDSATHRHLMESVTFSEISPPMSMDRRNSLNRRRNVTDIRDRKQFGHSTFSSLSNRSMTDGLTSSENKMLLSSRRSSSSSHILNVTRVLPNHENKTSLKNTIADEQYKKVYTEMESLKKCLEQSTKVKSITVGESIKSKSQNSHTTVLPVEIRNKNSQRSNVHSLFTYESKSGDSKPEQTKPNRTYQRPATSSLTLDRISEVDSNSISVTSSSPESCKEKLDNEAVSIAGEGDSEQDKTSSDVSWKVPDNVKKLLYE